METQALLLPRGEFYQKGQGQSGDDSWCLALCILACEAGVAEEVNLKPSVPGAFNWGLLASA